MKTIERKYERRAELFKALANPLRILMLEKLGERPWCVCALAADLGIDKSIISKYLSQLKSAGLIEDTKRGTLVEYRLVAPCILQLAACAEETILRQRKKVLNEV